MRASKELNLKDVCIKEDINLFRKSKKVFYINKIRKIDRIDTKKLNKCRFFFDIRVLSTSWNCVAIYKAKDFELCKILSFLNKFFDFFVYKEEKKLK